MDIEYWSNFYKNGHTKKENSLFSAFVLEFCNLLKDASILELGSGNGRDALFFAKSGMKVVAIDQIDDHLTYMHENIYFIQSDFTKINHEDFQTKFDCVYSRFTLHSISETQEDILLDSIPSVIKQGGFLAIEARGLKNSLYGKGRKVENENNAFYYDKHYRRFIDFEKFTSKLQKLYKNIEIIYASESRGFAPFNGEDDFFFRLIVKFL